jgi:hypothetical protein
MEAMTKLMILLAAVGACSGGSEHTDRPPTAAGSAAPKDCRTRAGELGTYLATMDHDPDVVPATLVQRDDLPKVAVASAPTLVVDGGDISFQGQLLDGPALDQRLVAIAKRIQDDIDAGKFAPGDAPRPHFVHLAFTPTARWDAIVAAAEACAATGCEADVLFWRPTSFVMPPRTPTDDELDRIMAAHAHDGQRQLADVTSKIIAQCPALIRAFGEIGSQTGDKAAYMIGAVAPALIECDCAADLDALRTVVVRVLVNPHPTTAVALRFDRTATKIALPAATTWADAAAKITATTGAAWFAVTP